MEDDLKEEARELHAALQRLDYLSMQLRSVALLIMALSMANVAVTLLVSGGIVRSFPSHLAELFVLTLPAALAVSVLFLAFRFDYLRKEGDAYFEELSDELHGKRASMDDSEKAERLSLRARVIIRTYTNTSSLPLVPGKYGPAIMAAVNLMLALQMAVIAPRFF